MLIQEYQNIGGHCFDRKQKPDYRDERLESGKCRERKKIIKEEALLPKLELEKSAHQQNSILDDHQNRPFDASTEDTKLELDFVKF